MKLPSLAGIGAKLAIAGGLLLGILLAVLKVFSLGKAAEKAKTQQAQREIETETKEAVDHAHQQNVADIQQARDARDRGDFSHLNDD